jgi:peptidoglycan/LPS O-acetylase OafA/YrhL
MPVCRGGPSKLQSVELIRFLAAFSVIIWHYPFYFFIPSGDLYPFSTMLSLFYNSGLYAVQWFWVLSGYIFFFNYREAVAARSITGFEFFSRRFARLYPLHLTTLLLVSALFLLYRNLFSSTYPYYTRGISVWTSASQFIMASNWTTTEHTFNGPVWSVSVEVLIYILFFVLTKYAGIKDFKRTFLIAVLCMTSYSLAARRGLGTPKWIAECAACFYLGGLVYEMRKRYPLDIAGGLWQILFWATLTIGIFAFYDFRPTYTRTFLIPASAILFVVCSDAIERSSIIARVARVGNWTYSSYLLHFPVALLIVIGIRVLDLDILAIAKKPIFLVAYVVLVFILSDLCYTYFEAPARRALRLATKVEGNVAL